MHLISRESNRINKKNAYFIVFQNKSYFEEKTGGYLWAPKETKTGKKVFHWSNMTKINNGDIIFSIYRRNIVSVNIAIGTSFSSKRPKSLDKLELWEEEGWMAKAEYNELDNPIIIDDWIEKILELCPVKYSPFNKNGGGNQGYLFEIGNNLGDYLMNLVRNSNNIKIQQ